MSYESNMMKLQEQRIAMAEKQIVNLEKMNDIAEKLIAMKDKETGELEQQVKSQALMIKMQEVQIETVKKLALAYAKQFIDIFPKYLTLTRPNLRVPETFYHDVNTLNLQLETGIIDEMSYSAELNRMVIDLAKHA